MLQIEKLHRRLVEHGPQGILEQGLFLLLRLLAAIYSFVLVLRDLSFKCGLRKSFSSQLPVIAVGNLAVGGTGKTPMVDFLARYAQQKGLRTAIVSRGYGGTYPGELGIVSLGNGLLLKAREAGDEPCLLAHRNPDALVLVAAKRRKAIEYLEENNCADLIILDDAFQHRQVARDLNLLLLDALHPFGNQYLLPAGLLRENKSALERADLICLTGPKDGSASVSFGKKTIRMRSSLAKQAVSLAGEKLLLETCRTRKVFAFAGIANAERFFAALEIEGVNLFDKLALGDHVDYDAELISLINQKAIDAEILLTTEKDAVKLSAEDFSLPCFSVGLDVSLEDAAPLLDRLDLLLNKDVAMPLSDELLGILACPKCKEAVKRDLAEGMESLVCTKCNLVYPVRDGIPVMLIDEATPFEP